ncbi:MAG: cupin domain-containing protein [Lentisphaeria bacterium]|nr:cupin domain-containing protein [Candidatus Neomarinimicrobiota bacterium]MCF7841986.1 cupin domain-containing protein [Lentisphaeria bacterium]
MNDRTDRYLLINKPVGIPVPGGKKIDEYVGQVNTNTDSVSVARMEAPPGWSEPVQQPAFDELTILLEGRLRVIIGGKTVTMSAGQVLMVNRGMRVQYENPYDKMAIYWAICMPAFTPDRAGREPGKRTE